MRSQYQTYTLPDYRRYRVPGGTYFFTINLLERRADLLVRHIEQLRETVKCTRADRPFHIDAWVVLPDHMHCVITLPPGDDDFSDRIKAMKIRFVQALPPTEGRSSIRMAKGERGIWQRRFWAHAIRDEADYARHMDYVHFNPFKHGYCISGCALAPFDLSSVGEGRCLSTRLGWRGCVGCSCRRA